MVSFCPIGSNLPEPKKPKRRQFDEAVDVAIRHSLRYAEMLMKRRCIGPGNLALIIPFDQAYVRIGALRGAWRVAITWLIYERFLNLDGADGPAARCCCPGIIEL